jgi:hypothetical protein
MARINRDSDLRGTNDLVLSRGEAERLAHSLIGQLANPMGTQPCLELDVDDAGRKTKYVVLVLNNGE